MKKISTCFQIFLVLIVFSGSAWAADVTLQWNPVSGATGYKIYYRPASAPAGQYLAPVDVGIETSGTIEGLEGPCFFAVTAYNEYGESGYSVECFANLMGVPVIIRITEDYGNGVSRETTIAP